MLPVAQASANRGTPVVGRRARGPVRQMSRDVGTAAHPEGKAARCGLVRARLLPLVPPASGPSLPRLLASHPEAATPPTNITTAVTKTVTDTTTAVSKTVTETTTAVSKTVETTTGAATKTVETTTG